MFKSIFSSIKVLSIFNKSDTLSIEDLLFETSMTEHELQKCLNFLEDKKYISSQLNYHEANNIWGIEPYFKYEITHEGTEYLSKIKLKAFVSFISVCLLPIICAALPTILTIFFKDKLKWII